MKLSRRQFMATLALSSLGAHKVLAGATNSPAPLSSIKACSWKADLQPKTIAIVGDIQRTSMSERLFLSRSQNDEERTRIFNAIADDKPDMLLMLGDQVFEGDSHEDWVYFDDLISRIIDAGIPVRAMMGNHDYGRDRAQCSRNFCARFPAQKDAVHSMVRLGSIALVTVDSNLDQLSPAQIGKQSEEYGEWIKALDADPAITGVIVASHHPPYTNADLGSTPEVIEMFAKPFLEARKTRLYLSGHIHSYERFVTGDKMFVVAGGGGGPRRSVSISPNRPNQNDAYRVGTLRPFHYVRLRIDDDAMSAEVMMLPKGGTKFTVGDSFRLGLYGGESFANR